MDMDTDVAVVGAGPTGLAAAGELARRGHRVTVLDSAVAPKVVEIVKQNDENQIFDKEPEAQKASFAARIPVLPDVWFTQDVKTELH